MADSLQSATDRELIRDAMSNPNAEEAAQALAEWHRRCNAKMRRGND